MVVVRPIWHYIVPRTFTVDFQSAVRGCICVALGMTHMTFRITKCCGFIKFYVALEMMVLYKTNIESLAPHTFTIDTREDSKVLWVHVFQFV